jgi:hypothetical protein
MPALKPISEKTAEGSPSDFISVKTIREGQVLFNCTLCGAYNSIADVQEIIENYSLLRGLSRLFSSRGGNVYRSLICELFLCMVCLIIPPRFFLDIIVTCSACGKKFRSLLRIDEMVCCSPEELEPYIRFYSTLIEKTIVTFGLLLFLVPLVGMALSLLGLYLCRGTRDWARIVGLIGLGLGGGVTATLGIFLLFDLFGLR